MPYTEVWFADQNCQPLEIEGKINLTLVNLYKHNHKTEFRDKTYVKGYVSLPSDKDMSKNIGNI